MTSQPQGKDCLNTFCGSLMLSWCHLPSGTLLESFDLLAHLLAHSYSSFLILLSHGDPQQQSRILTQFWRFCRQNMAPSGQVYYLDMNCLDVLGHLNLEALGIFWRLNLIQVWVFGYLYLEEFGEFCQLNLDPVWALGCSEVEELGEIHHLILVYSVSATHLLQVWQRTCLILVQLGALVFLNAAAHGEDELLNLGDRCFLVRN